jgi:hypothetical protein
MLRTWIAAGALLFVAGAVTLLLFLVPLATRDAGPTTAPGAGTGEVTDVAAANDTLASGASDGVIALLAGIAMAGGALLVMVGMGRWRNPRRLGGRFPVDDADPTRTDLGT